MAKLKHSLRSYFKTSIFSLEKNFICFSGNLYRKKTISYQRGKNRSFSVILIHNVLTNFLLFQGIILMFLGLLNCPQMPDCQFFFDQLFLQKFYCMYLIYVQCRKSRVHIKSRTLAKFYYGKK